MCPACYTKNTLVTTVSAKYVSLPDMSVVCLTFTYFTMNYIASSDKYLTFHHRISHTLLLVTTQFSQEICYHKNTLVTTLYHKHPVRFLEKSNHYQTLPHVASLLHKKCAHYHLHSLCFIEKSNCYQSLPHVASLLHKKCTLYHLLPQVHPLFYWEI